MLVEWVVDINFSSTTLSSCSILRAHGLATVIVDISDRRLHEVCYQWQQIELSEIIS